jgi:hypothetical protein
LSNKEFSTYVAGRSQLEKKLDHPKLRRRLQSRKRRRHQ